MASYEQAALTPWAQQCTCDEALRVLHDWLEDALERLLQLMLQVVLAVDGQVVLQRVDRVFRLLPRLRALRRLPRPSVQRSRTAGLMLLISPTA